MKPLGKHYFRTGGVDAIMKRFSIGRYRAREVWGIMHQHNISMEDAYEVYKSGKDIDEW